MPQAPFRAGDHVRHRPSDEKWVIAAVGNRGDVYPAGWPCTCAAAEDCDLVRAASDEEHDAMIFDLCRSSRRDGDVRHALAMNNLLLRMGRGEAVPPDLAAEAIRGIRLNIQHANQAVELVFRRVYDMTSLCKQPPAWMQPADIQASLAQAFEDWLRLVSAAEDVRCHLRRIGIAALTVSAAAGASAGNQALGPS